MFWSNCNFVMHISVKSLQMKSYYSILDSMALKNLTSCCAYCFCLCLSSLCTSFTSLADKKMVFDLILIPNWMMCFVSTRKLVRLTNLLFGSRARACLMSISAFSSSDILKYAWDLLKSALVLHGSMPRACIYQSHMSWDGTHLSIIEILARESFLLKTIRKGWTDLAA